MLSTAILIPAILNGLLTGAVYALVALGLTLIYGVLHIINFAHGALLTAALFAAFFAHRLLGLDPYLAAFALTPAFFAIGYALQRFVIGPASRRRGPQHPAGHARARGRHRERAALRVSRRHAHDQPALRLRGRSISARLPVRAARHRLRRRAARRAAAVAAADRDRSRQGDPRGGQGETRRRSSPASTSPTSMR